MRNWTFVCSALAACQGQPIASGEPVVDALCAAWQRCAPEIGELFVDAGTCARFVDECNERPLFFANPEDDVAACSDYLAGAKCSVIAAAGLLPFGGETIWNRLTISASTDPRAGFDALRVDRSPCADLWLARPTGRPRGLGQSCEGFDWCYDRDAWCDGDTDVCVERSGLDEECSGEYGDDSCVFPLSCNNGCEPHSRVAPTGARGDPCQSTTECSGGLTCRGAECSDRGGETSPCTSHEDCLLGLECDGGTGECVALSLCAGAAGEGHLCHLDATCADGTWCNTCAGDDPNCLYGRCDRFQKLGQWCADGQAWLGRCAPGLVCIVDECMVGDLPAGADCEFARQCVSVRCVDGRCQS